MSRRDILPNIEVVVQLMRVRILVKHNNVITGAFALFNSRTENCISVMGVIKHPIIDIRAIINRYVPI